MTWRTSLKERIEKEYIHNPSQEWFYLYHSTFGSLDIAIVSDQFINLSRGEREERIKDLLSQLDLTFKGGMRMLYTPEEARRDDFTLAGLEGRLPTFTWLDLVFLAANLDEHELLDRREPRNPRTIAFYSFKGGVGRTTALIHVAWILAMQGHKVVAVDLDLEAPGLASAFNLSSDLPYGIADYLEDRAHLTKDLEPQVSVAQIVKEVSIPNASGSLFVVPAGNLSLDYIAMVYILRPSVVRLGKDPWTFFFEDINCYLQPDIILVDSHSGINKWGAFSLLQAADEALIFLYPDQQNTQGVDLVLKALAGKIGVQLVFSPVPSDEFVQKAVAEQWSLLQQGHTDILTLPIKGELAEGSESRIAGNPPIIVPYLKDLERASSFPILPLASHYMRIANVIC